MATVLTAPKGNPLWIPSDTPGREDWEEVIYGVKNVKRAWYNFRKSGNPAVVGPAAVNNLLWSIPGFYRGNPPANKPGYPVKDQPLFGPVFVPFWEYYGFLLEEELDEYLSKYAHKLVNFDWEDTLRALYFILDAYVARLKLSPTIQMRPLPFDEVPKAKQLYAAEYLYYLGPIKFALKYNYGVPAIDMVPPSKKRYIHASMFLVPSAAGRNTIIFNLFNGEKIKVQTLRGTEQARAAIRQETGYPLWTETKPGDQYLLVVLEALKLPNVISIEASDELIPDKKANRVPGVYSWRNIGSQGALRDIKRNYMQLKVPAFFSQTAQPTTTGSTTVLTTNITPPTKTETLSPTSSPVTVLTTTPSPSETSTLAPTTTVTTTPTPTTTTETPSATVAPTQAGGPTVTSTAGESKLITGASSLGLLALAGVVLYLLFRRK